MIATVLMAALLASPDVSASKARPKPPKAEEIIAALFRMQSTPLTRGEYCKSTIDDMGEKTTIGTYLARWLAVFSEVKDGRGRRQWLTATCELDDGHRAKWKCRFAVNMQVIGKDVMVGGVGLMFLMDERKEPVPSWFMCVGSG